MKNSDSKNPGSKLAQELKKLKNQVLSKGEIENIRRLLNKSLHDDEDTKASFKEMEDAKDLIIKNTKSFPSWTEDPTGNDKEGKKISDKLKSYGLEGTGKILWAYGYDNLEYLGNGCDGVAWKDSKNKKVVKITKPTSKNGKIRVGPDEFATRTIQRILEQDASARKYIINIKNLNKAYIYESPLANCDFYAIGDKKSELRKTKEGGKGTKHIKNLITSAKSLLKALMILHKKGYVHNDIKPDNMLQIPRDLNSVEEENEDPSKKKKNKAVLTDFGTITSIQRELDNPLSYKGCL